MLDFVHWSAALLALIGLLLWCGSGGIHVLQTAGGGRFVAGRQRQLRRIAVCAAAVSALLQASTSAPPTQLDDIDLWASTAPAHIVPVG